jgi:hypothetical protein
MALPNGGEWSFIITGLAFLVVSRRCFGVQLCGTELGDHVRPAAVVLCGHGIDAGHDVLGQADGYFFYFSFAGCVAAHGSTPSKSTSPAVLWWRLVASKTNTK